MYYRPDIDGLRAVAVLPVVFYHAGLPGPSGGFIGVDVFFVISGFLITSIVAEEIAQGRFSLISFYEKRARRILPALMAVIFASSAVGWFVLLPTEMKSLGQSIVATAFFLSNVYFTLTTDYFAQSAEFKPLLHTWSLAVEEQFYLFFPPLLMLLAYEKLLKPIWVITSLSLLSFVLSVFLLSLKPDWVFYQIIFRTWELGAGAIIALGSFSIPKRRITRELIGIAGISAIIVPIFAYESSTPFPGTAALPPVIGASILIWIGAKGGGSGINKLLSHRSLVWVGLISYSLYLWHWPIFAFLRISLGTTTLPIALSTGAVIMSFVIAWLSLHFVERPFRVHHSKGLGRRSIFIVSTTSIATVTVAGWILHTTGGLPGRLPSDVVALAAFAADRNSRSEECTWRTPSQGLCSIGKPLAPSANADFILWGDSHADAFMPGLDIAADGAKKSGIFAGIPACVPILGVQRDTNGQDCTRFNKSIWSWLELQKDIPLVILAARWTFAVEGTRYGGEGGGDMRLDWIGGSDLGPNDVGNASIVEAGLNATVAKILFTKRNVILLGPVPEAGQNVPSVYAREALLDWTSPTAITRKQYEMRAGATEEILRRVADAHAGVRYIPLSDLFCGDDVCKTISEDGKLLYVDDDHISQTAAIALLPQRLLDIWEIDQ